MDTKHQLADILTKGNFTRDKWNNLLRLLNISNHGSNNELQKMAKRVQDKHRRRKSHCKVKADDELGVANPGVIFNSAEVGCIKPPGDAQCIEDKFESHSKHRETCRTRLESKRHSIEFSSVANECKDDKRRENCRAESEPRAHPIFRGTSAFERGTLKSKGGGKSSIHFCGDAETIEVIFRTIISVNQLSIYGAVADMCEESILLFSDDSASAGRLAAQEEPEAVVPPPDVLNEKLTSDQ